MSTIGCDFKIKTLPLSNGKVVKMQIWDSAGQERFRSLAAAYYRGAHSLVLAFDVTDVSTFNNLRRWLDQVRPSMKEGVPVALVATKCDAGEEQEEVSREQVVRFIEEEGAGMLVRSFRTSSKSGDGIHEVFEWIAEEVSQKNEAYFAKDGQKTQSKEKNRDKMSKFSCCQ